MFNLRIMPHELAAAVAACAQFAEPNSKIPILKCLRIEVEAGFATFVATNTEQSIVIRAACEGEGSACIDAAALQAKVSRLKGGDPVKFDMAETMVVVSHGRTKWKLPSMTDEFPQQVAKIIEAEPVDLPANFLSWVRQVEAAINPNDARDYLRGVNIRGGSMRATDGKKASSFATGLDLPEITIPMSAIKKLATIGQGPIKLASNSLTASFFNEFVRVNTQLIGDNYPDLGRVISGARETSPHSVIVDAGEIRAAVERAAAIKVDTEKAGSYIALQFRIRETEIEIATRNRDGEEGIDYAACRRTGADADVAVDASTFLTIAGSLPAIRLRINYGGQENPLIISDADAKDDDPENVRVVMPRHWR